MIRSQDEDPGLRWVECPICKNLECSANLVFCFICVGPDLCYDCLKTHESEAHTKAAIEQFFAEVVGS